MALNISLLLFENAETLDYAGPLEVFGTLRDVNAAFPAIDFICVDKKDFHDRFGLHIHCPQFFHQLVTPPDIVVIPGGRGINALLENVALHEWLTKVYEGGSMIFSVCTGALLLAAAGLLKDKKAITHQSSILQMKDLEPYVSIEANKRYVFQDNILTAGGVSAGIDAALWLVKEKYGVQVESKVMQEMEYTKSFS